MRIALSPLRWSLALTIAGMAAATGIARQPAPTGQQPTTTPAGQAAGRQGGPPERRLPRLPALPFPDAAQELETLGPKIRVVPLFKGLANPWSMAWLPNGDMLITEKPGRLRIVRNGTLEPQPVAGVPQVVAQGQGGLMEVAVHPKYAENRFIYLTYSKAGEKGRVAASKGPPSATSRTFSSPTTGTPPSRTSDRASRSAATACCI